MNSVDDRTLHTHCLRCGRRLKTEEAQRNGYGQVCAKKLHKTAGDRLFKVSMIYLKQEENDGRK